MQGPNHQIRFNVHRNGSAAEEVFNFKAAVIAGWTGRDATALEKHIHELEALGVARPASTPIFYRVSAALLTTAPVIEVPSDHSSGEVEFALLNSGGRLYVGVGSDHTDRKVETYGVTVSKQMCAKPLAPVLWDMADVASHWDELVLRAWAVDGDRRELYQEGKVTAMLAPTELLNKYSSEGLGEGTAMFCGTLAVHGGIRPANRFEFELEDPVLRRSIKHGYDVLSLPVLG